MTFMETSPSDSRTQSTTSSLRRKSLGMGKHGNEEIDKENLPVNNDEEEKRIRRRQSKAFQQKRKSLTPNTKKNQFISEMYSTIIQMSSENKINQKNSWSLDLIDHMQDILDEKKEKDDKMLYNFQKASCTLDASVKIYSYRVDDTWSSSLKILENLNRSENSKPTLETTNDSEKKERSHNNRHKKNFSGSTIEKNINNINTQQFDLDVQVDPLFHKMSKSFDEGGAKGMLLVNMNVYNGCNLIFDSNDIVLLSEQQKQQEQPIAPDVLDLSKEPIHLLGNEIENLEICPQLQKYYHEIDGLCDKITETMSIADEVQVDCDYDDQDDHFNDDAWQQEQDLQTTLENSMLENDENNENECPMDNLPHVVSMNELNREVISSKDLEELFLASDQQEYQFFDPKMIKKNWAGLEHWKFDRKVAKPTVSSNSRMDEKTQKQTAKEKAKYIDFTCVIDESLFKVPHLLSTNCQSSAALKKAQSNASSLVFPTDIHYTLSNMLSLFTKPSSTCSLMGTKLSSKHVVNDSTHFQGDGGEETCFYDAPGEEEDEYMNECIQDFDHMDLLQADRIVNKIDIKYETVAKKVDVKKLKDTIWNSIKPNNTQETEANISNTSNTSSQKVLETTSETLSSSLMLENTTKSLSELEVGDEENHPSPMTFENLVNQIAPSVPSNVTVPFYFICVLHLANEKGLELVGQEDLENFFISESTSSTPILT